MTTQSLDYAPQRHGPRRLAAWWVALALAIAFALAGWRLYVWWAVRTELRQAQAANAAAAAASLGAALDAFATDGGRYPTNAEGLDALIHQPPDIRKWNGPYLRSAAIATDPWGNRYSYTETGGAYRVTSPGPDGKPGTPDDITASGPRAGSPLLLPQ